MNHYLNQLSLPTYDPGVVSENDQYAGIKKIAKEQDYFDPGNLLFGAAGGMPMVAGSLAKGRMPMRLQQYEPKAEDLFNNSTNPNYEPTKADYALYRFRNRLGDPKFAGSVDMILDPATKHAHLSGYQITGRDKSTSSYVAPGVAGHQGGTPAQYKAMMTRLAEEIQGSGYTSVSGDPISQGRKSIGMRVFKQLKNEGILDPKTEIKLSDPGNLGRYESAGMAGVFRRREEAQEAERYKSRPLSATEHDYLQQLQEPGETAASRAFNQRLQESMRRIRRSQNAPNDYDEELANLQGTPPRSIESAQRRNSPLDQERIEAIEAWARENIAPHDPTIRRLNRFRNAAGRGNADLLGPTTPRGQEWRDHVEMFQSEQAARDNQRGQTRRQLPQQHIAGELGNTNLSGTALENLRAMYSSPENVSRPEPPPTSSNQTYMQWLLEDHRLARLARPRD
jgi:hypothetical protein